MKRTFTAIAIVLLVSGLARAEGSQVFQANLETKLIQNLKEYSNLGFELVGDMSYQVYAPFRLGAQLELMNSFTRYKKEGQNFSFEDTLLYLANPKLGVWEGPGIQMSALVGVVLPTSKTSQDATLRLAYLGDFTLSKSFEGFRLTLLNRVYLFDHKFSTATASGGQSNPYLALVNRLQLNAGIVGDLSFSLFAELFHQLDYRDNLRTLYRIEGGPIYSVSDQLNLFVKMRARDRIVSNNSFLDDDTLRVEGGLTYEF